jgi:glycosyltransferase involved in cell wall biosynthesis
MVEKVEKNDNPPSVLVIIAALNEEKGIGLSLAELRMVLPDPKCLVVDGNSADKTVEFAKEMGADILIQGGIGKGDAIAQAIKSVDLDVDYVIFTDADYTYPAKSVPEMIRILDENPEIGMVCGNRFTHSLTLSAMKSLFFVGNRFLAWTQRFINGVHLNDPLTGLRVIRWNILRDWEPKSKGFDIEAEINHRVEKKGYKIVEIPIDYRSRVGEKKLKLRDGLTIFRRIVAESFS